MTITIYTWELLQLAHMGTIAIDRIKGFHLLFNWVWTFDAHYKENMALFICFILSLLSEGQIWWLKGAICDGISPISFRFWFYFQRAMSLNQTMKLWYLGNEIMFRLSALMSFILCMEITNKWLIAPLYRANRLKLHFGTFHYRLPPCSQTHSGATITRKSHLLSQTKAE